MREAQSRPSDSIIGPALCPAGYTRTPLLSVPAWPVKQYWKTSCRCHLRGRDERDGYVQHRFWSAMAFPKSSSHAMAALASSACLRRRTARVSDVPVQVIVLGGGEFEVFILASEVHSDLVGGLSPAENDHTTTVG